MSKFLCGLGFILLAACSSMAPDYQRPAAPVAGEFPSGAAYKDGGNKNSAPAAEIGWRDFMQDARLQRLVEIALANNRDLRVAALNVREAQAQYRIQRSGLFPQAGAFADASRSRSAGNTTQQYEAGIAAAWELDFFGRVQSLSDAALQQYFATGYARQAAEILLVSQVANQYLAMLAFDEQLLVTRQTLATAEESYKIVKLQFDTGTAPELTLQQSQSVVEQANANLAAQVRFRAQAENALVLLLGQLLPADLPLAVRLNDQRILADVPAGLPSDLLARRPDILQAEALLRAENANIGAARAAFFPRVTLTSSIGTASSEFSGLFDKGSKAWSFAPQVTLPIFDAGSNQAGLDSARAGREIAVAQYEKSIQTAFREVADALAGRATLGEQLRALRAQTNAEEVRFKLSDLRYRNGIASALDLLDSQRELYSVQQAAVQTRLLQLQNQVVLYKTLGGGWATR